MKSLRLPPSTDMALLRECDVLRDETLVELGVRLEDRDGRSVVKLVGKEAILEERERERKVRGHLCRMWSCVAGTNSCPPCAQTCIHCTHTHTHTGAGREEKTKGRTEEEVGRSQGEDVALRGAASHECDIKGQRSF